MKSVNARFITKKSVLTWVFKKYFLSKFKFHGLKLAQKPTKWLILPLNFKEKNILHRTKSVCPEKKSKKITYFTQNRL